MKIITKIKAIKEVIKRRIDRAVEKVALHFVFLLGIGITSIIAKLFFKKFITKKYSFTSWNKYQKNKNVTKMY